MQRGDRKDLETIFGDMAYSARELGLEPLQLLPSSKPRIINTSILNGEAYEGGTLHSTYEVEGFRIEDKRFGLQELEDTSRTMLSAANPEVFSRKVDADKRGLRMKKLKELVTNSLTELSMLEALAGHVTWWTVNTYDAPLWVRAIDFQEKMNQSEMHDGSSLRNTAIIFLPLATESYSLHQIIMLLTSVVQTDQPILILTQIKNNHSWQCLLPVLSIINLMNTSKIREHPIHSLNIHQSVTIDDCLETISKPESPFSSNPRILVVGNDGYYTKLGAPVAACLNLKEGGKFLHFIVDHDADFIGSGSVIENKAWLSGIELNHRCRTMMFVHEYLSSTMEGILAPFAREMSIGTSAWELGNFNFIVRKPETLPAFLATVPGMGIFGSTPTLYWNAGTSDELVTRKEVGLGQLIVVMTYRTTAELLALANNYGEPDMAYVFSNSAMMELVKGLKANEIILNGADSGTRWHPKHLSWSVLSKYATPDTEATMPPLKQICGVPDCKVWQNYSTQERLSHAERLFRRAGLTWENFNEIARILIGRSDISEMLIEKSGQGRSTQLICVNVEQLPAQNFLTVLCTCLLRASSLNLILVNTVIPTEVQTAMEALPHGLINLIILPGVYCLQGLHINNSDLVWVLQGKNPIPFSSFPPRAVDTTILVNDAADLHGIVENAYESIYADHVKCHLSSEKDLYQPF